MISNPESAIEKALEISSELATAWDSSDIKRKEKLQRLLFPDGIIYDRKIGAFRTTRINFVFQLIASLAYNTANEKRGQTDALHRLSPLAEGEGLLHDPFKRKVQLF